jgi:hypothetical protein
MSLVDTLDIPAETGQDTFGDFDLLRPADFLPGEQLVGEHLLAHQVEDHLFRRAPVNREIDFHG